jgi:hypothetical protein
MQRTPLIKINYSFILASFLISTQALADTLDNGTLASVPWGGASVTATEYKPQKVVYDVHVKTVKEVESVLDRASYLSTEYHNRCRSV